MKSFFADLKAAIDSAGLSTHIQPSDQTISAIVARIAVTHGAVVAQNVRSYLDAVLSTYTWDEILEFFETRGSNPFDGITTRREEEDNFDDLNGTTTSYVYEQVELPEIVSGERGIECGRYHPSPVKSVRLALDKLQGHGVRFRDFCFVDVGSGLGRNLLIASHYPFKKIIGIEISEYLNRVAVHNIQQYQSKHGISNRIETQCIDALHYDFPDENLILYFWETFGKRSSEEFCRKVEQCVSSSKKKMILMFLGKSFNEIHTSCRFKLIEAFKTHDNTLSSDTYFDVSMFEVVG